MFGTRKAKRAILALTENAISPGPRGDGAPKELSAGELALMESLKETTAKMATREELQAAVDIAKPVPRGNYDADEIQDVYVADEIIGADVLRAVPVRDWQQTLKAGEEITAYSRFVASRVSRVGAHDEALQRLRLLRYLYWVLVFWKHTQRGKERGTRKILAMQKLKKELAPAPDMVVENIRRKFSEGGEMRKFHVDLLMTHCCVFASIIDSFEVNMIDLREDLSQEQKQMNQYFMEIGAQIKVVKSEDRKDYIAKLSLPLRFPKTRQKRRSEVGAGSCRGLSGRIPS